MASDAVPTWRSAKFDLVRFMPVDPVVALLRPKEGDFCSWNFDFCAKLGHQSEIVTRLSLRISKILPDENFAIPLYTDFVELCSIRCDWIVRWRRLSLVKKYLVCETENIFEVSKTLQSFICDQNDHLQLIEPHWLGIFNCFDKNQNKVASSLTMFYDPRLHHFRWLGNLFVLISTKVQGYFNLLLNFLLD